MLGKFIGMAALAASFMAGPVFAQTAAELLQKGIYTQETAGDLDSAILIYRQIVNSAPAQRDIAAQAQYRLAQSLLQKGDLSNAAVEFDRLARDFSEYRTLISSMAGPGRGQFRISLASPGQPGADFRARVAKVQAELEQLRSQSSGPEGAEVKAREAQLRALVDTLKAQEAELQASTMQPLATMQFDPTKPVTVTGAVTRIIFANPLSSILIEGQDQNGNSGKWIFVLAAPRVLEQHGFKRTTVKPGDRVTVNGDLGSGQPLPDGSIPASATTITSSSGQELFNRAQLGQ